MRTFKHMIAIPPGYTIKDELEFLKMKQKDFAERMGMAEKTISQIITGKAPLTHDTALKLEHVLGIPAYMWNNLEASYRTTLKKIEDAEEIEKEWEFVDNIPIKKMMKRKWIKEIKIEEKGEIIQEIRNFFSVASLNLLERVGADVFQTCNFKTTKNKEVSKYSVAAWIRKGEIEASNINTEIFNKNKIKENIFEFKKLSMINSKENFEQLKELCRKNGIALIIVPYFPDTNVFGVSKWIDKDTALIILSNKGKMLDSFWFSFFHELGHLMKHKKKLFINQGDIKSTLKIEEEANKFAKNTLIPVKEYRKIKEMQPLNINNIKEFAKKLSIHPSIIVGRLQFEKIIKYSEFSSLKEKTKLQEEEKIEIT